MTKDRHLKIGCCTAVLDRPIFARLNRLQVAAQTRLPDFHAIVATANAFHRNLLNDLIDRTTLYREVPPESSTLAAFSLGLKELFDRKVDLFFCLDHDCLYYRDYVESICRFVRSKRLNLKKGDFCLTLAGQHWINLYEDDSATVEMRSCAASTFVFGRAAAAAAIDAAKTETSTSDASHDITWRRALDEAGIEITQVKTRAPVFGHVQRGRPLAEKQTLLANGHGGGAARDSIDVSVIIPTFNEGAWLQRTVESVLKARTRINYEIVIVDDGCTDGSVQLVAGAERVRVARTGASQLGLLVAKNLGAKTARGRYICFIDSHVLVHDYWLDYLRETCDRYPAGVLVSGNLTDVDRFTAPNEFDDNQYSYVIRNCFLGTGWHHHGRSRHTAPYLGPLTPGGLMFARKLHFVRLGGFDQGLRKWGAEDVQISLQNYCMGGASVVDPRVVIYHYFKNDSNRKRSFTITNEQHAFNCLRVAATYFPREYYCKVRDAHLARGSGTPEIVAEIESVANHERIQRIRSKFTRDFQQWIADYSIELGKFIEDTRAGRPVSAAPPKSFAKPVPRAISA